MWKFWKIICFLGFLEVTVLAQIRPEGLPTPTLPLPSEAYSEGECISPSVVNVDVNWIIQQRMFYVPIASQFALHRYAETLLSRPPVSEAELNSMCLTVEASQTGAALNLTNVGFDDREFRQTCAPGEQPGRINCFAAGSSAGVNPTKTRATEDFVVAWDSRSYMIIVRCVDGFFRDFSVLSIRPTVSHDVYNSVLNVTRHLGFDERRIQTTTYDDCLRNSGGLHPSKYNLKKKTGPFTNSVLEAPFSNVKLPLIHDVSQNQHHHEGHQDHNAVPVDHHNHHGHHNSQIPIYPQVHNNHHHNNHHQGQIHQQPRYPQFGPPGPGGPGGFPGPGGHGGGYPSFGEGYPQGPGQLF